MSSIESEIHHILLDIDPSLHKDYEEQSVIIAEASANYRFATKNSPIRISSKINSNNEALIIDCLLQAMNSYINIDPPKYAYAANCAECSDEELDYETVLKNIRFSGKEDMSIINDDDLDTFLENSKDDSSLFDIKDIWDDQRPNSELYSAQKKHRSDSQAR
jgi:hypothetical protein